MFEVYLDFDLIWGLDIDFSSNLFFYIHFNFDFDKFDSNIDFDFYSALGITFLDLDSDLYLKFDIDLDSDFVFGSDLDIDTDFCSALRCTRTLTFALIGI
jgi:hypothetical protein